MKKLLFITAALLLQTAAFSQSVRSYKNSSTAGNGLVYTLPRTNLSVNIVCERESIRKGPYARFAQKYFGVMAPLADKDVYTIVGASIVAKEEADPSQVYVLENASQSPVSLYDGTSEGAVAIGIDGQGKGASRFDDIPSELYLFQDLGLSPMVEQRTIVSYNESDTSFVRVPISRQEIVERSIEEQAEQAVEAIFNLRRRRFDLVTGEAGENVFGAGLGDAIEEMKRLENEYLSLFFGKTFKQQVVRSYDVIPEKGRTTAIVCRFSELGGLMPASDLSGSPIVLEMTPEGKTTGVVLPTIVSKDDRGKVYVRVADVAACRLLNGSTEILSERVPIFQFGEIIEAPISAISSK